MDIGLGVGIPMLLVGVAMVVFARRLAIANDTRGPLWLRNFSMHGPDPARPGRTKPWMLRLFAVIFVAAGLALIVAALVGAK